MCLRTFVMSFCVKSGKLCERDSIFAHRKTPQSQPLSCSGVFRNQISFDSTGADEKGIAHTSVSWQKVHASRSFCETPSVFARPVRYSLASFKHNSVVIASHSKICTNPFEDWKSWTALITIIVNCLSITTIQHTKCPVGSRVTLVTVHRFWDGKKQHCCRTRQQTLLRLARDLLKC